ncbi:MAG TPA: hypothetical protein VGQ09_04850 [Chitinophagaceae bacterium]|nr:hypothetical protein [Chitinophagaceae bacterium]
MAEIHVQTKKKTTPVWVWIVLALLVLGVLAYVLMRNNKANEANKVSQPNPTSFVQPQIIEPGFFYS